MRSMARLVTLAALTSRRSFATVTMAQPVFDKVVSVSAGGATTPAAGNANADQQEQTRQQPLSVFKDADPLQVAMMEEEIIIVDEHDNVLHNVTTRSKKDTHLWANIGGSKNLLHRAFSTFLFDDKHRMLVQRRAASKITFPGFWANTCCSHPLYVPSELDMTSGMVGVKRAAQRKLEQ